MNARFLLVGTFLLCGADKGNAIPYTDIYDISQGGYDGGLFPGTVNGTIKITDNDGDGTISANDSIVGSLIFRRSIENGRTYVRGFDVTGILGSSLLDGEFSILGMSHLGGPCIVTNTRGYVVNYDFPFTGAFTASSSDQEPVVKKRVPDGGNTLGLFLLGLFSLQYLAFRR